MAIAVQTDLTVDYEKSVSVETLTQSPADGDCGIRQHSTPPVVCRRWQRSWFRFGPLSGLCSILLAASALVASLGILAGSNGQLVEGWYIPPPTYLAIFTAIANLCVRYAATQGAIITWWRRASAGTTLSELHSDWRVGNMIRGAITAGPRMTLLGVVCIVSTLVVIDGPLLQRASTVVIVNNPGSASLQISMAPEIPHDFTGTWSTSAELGDGGYASNNVVPINDVNLQPIVNGWWADNSLAGAVRGCPGSCTATIHAPALFAKSCEQYELPLDPWVYYNTSATNEGTIAAPLEVEGFLIAPSLGFDQGSEVVNLVTGFATFDSNCKGTLVYTACNYASSIGQYNVEIEANEITMATLSTPTQIAFANNTAVNHTEGRLGHPSTLGGVANFVSIKWESYVAYYAINNSTLGYNVAGSFGPPQFQVQGGNWQCASYTDPHESVVGSMNKLMLYLGAGAAKEGKDYLASHMDAGLSVESTVVGRLQGQISIYSTNYWWFFGAAALDALCLAVLLPTYWAWWRIGRPVSFSPLEIAKAFKSPLLADHHSNSTGKELAARAGTAPVRYGIITTTNGSELGFGAADAVLSPPEEAVSVDI